MINNRSITEYSVRELRENIGVVNQEPVLSFYLFLSYSILMLMIA